MKHLKTINELHKDTYKSARDMTAKYLGKNSAIDKRYKKLIDDDEHIDIPDKFKELYRNARRSHIGYGNWRDHKETINTILPFFPGFYETNFNLEGEEENEIEYINGIRKEKGWDEISWDDVDFDINWEGYAREITKSVENIIREIGFDVNIEFRKITKPRNYYYGNDTIEIVLSFKPIQVKQYLSNNLEELEKHLGNNGVNNTHPEEWVDELDNNNNNVYMAFDFIINNNMDMMDDFYVGIDGSEYIRASNIINLIEKEIYK